VNWHKPPRDLYTVNQQLCASLNSQLRRVPTVVEVAALGYGLSQVTQSAGDLNVPVPIPRFL
jgi:hypothetical protein